MLLKRSLRATMKYQMNIAHVPAEIREQRTTRKVTVSALCEAKIQAIALIAPITPGVVGNSSITVIIGITMHIAAKSHAHFGGYLLAMLLDGSIAWLSFERRASGIKVSFVGRVHFRSVI